ncbi:MAG: hypothetical protein P8Q97_09530 [Myxococcota bacterium]|nr:hypothetical protein [Myxococcota bacterium]
MSWADVAGAQGYKVSRSCVESNAEGFCPVASLPKEVLSYADVSVESGRPYTYSVEALVDGGPAPVKASITTPPTASLPVSTPPIYPTPQGAWSLGEALSLASIRSLRILHNQASTDELRILLDTEDAHSLVSRLEGADYAVVPKSRKPANLRPGEGEIYFHNFSRKAAITDLPPGVQPFDRMGDEGYVLVAQGVPTKGLRIVVGANTPEGLFRGGQVVERLLIEVESGRRRSHLEPVVVWDYPDHPRRGAYPSWRPMSANWSSIPEKTLDMLDSLARSGANSVDWIAHWSSQEEYSWQKTGARAAALVQIEAGRRFMDVNYFMGASYVGYGTKGPPEVEVAQLSLDQLPYGDGLGVVREPFFWIEAQPGKWQAAPERQGRLVGGWSGSGGSPWLATPCSGAGWQFGPQGKGSAGGSGRVWRLTGPARDCELAQSLDLKGMSSEGRYFLEGRLRSIGPVVGFEGSLTLEVEAGGRTRRFSVPLGAGSTATGEGQEFELLIPGLATQAPIRQARLVVRASLSSGSLGLDGVSLRGWDDAVLSSGNFSSVQGWQLGSGQGALKVDGLAGRNDTKSLRAELPLVPEKGKGAQIAQRYQPVRLEAGRYVLGAWVKAADDAESRLSKPTQAVSVKGDINLYFFDQASAQGSQTDKRLAKEFLSLPGQLDPSQESWRYFAHVFDVSEEMAERVRSVRVQVRFFASPDAGRVWLDDIELRRLDGDLRNLRGVVAPPLLETRSGARLVEGEDYEICQVGTQETICFAPQNYERMLEGGQGATYDFGLNPFEIRWLGKEAPPEKRVLASYDIGAQYSSVDSPRKQWDGQTTVEAALNLCDFDLVAKGIELEKILARYLDGYELKNFPNWGETYTFKADSVTWGVSEVRGVNRSWACTGEDGKLRNSNAALFARVVNNIFSATIEKHPGAHFWLWADMFNPFSNGGDKDYQLRYGGQEGRSACALAPGLLPSLCASEVEKVPLSILDHVQAEGGAILMKPWSYPPFALRRMVAVAAWYQEIGIKSQVLSGASPINVDDWAAIANTFSAVEGGVATIFHAERYGGESGLARGLQAFWNHDWKVLYLFDGESPSSSFYQIDWPFLPVLKLKNATADHRGRCAVFSEKFKGNSDGGICLDPSLGQASITLEEITIEGGARYRVDLMARTQKGFRAIGVAAPKISGRWSTGESIGPIASTLIYESARFPSQNTFDRYRAEIKAPEGAEGLSLEIKFSESFEAADDIAIFESFGACFDDCLPPLQAPSRPLPKK